MSLAGARILVTASFWLLIGCAPAARLTTAEHASQTIMKLSSSPYQGLKARFDALFPDTLFPPSNVGMKVVSLSTGETLYELNSDLIFNPASNQKLFTSAAALWELGEDFLFKTRISFDTLNVDQIFVKGFGDPFLSTADIESIATVVSRSLPGGKTWTIVGDVSYFDDLYLGSGWMWDDEPSCYNMFLTPLSVNGNCIDVHVRPGSLGGDSVEVSTEPRTRYVTIENNGRTVEDTVINALEVSRKWRERLNAISVAGEMLKGDSLSSTELSVWQPEHYTLTLLAEKLQGQAATIGGIRLDTVPSTATPILDYTHRLDSVVTYLNKESDNLSAENILKTLGAEKRSVPGSAAKGISVLHEFLNGNDIDTSRIVLVDGSGLSRYNLTSADVLIRLLLAMHKRPEHFDAFYTSLPIAGVDGTLSDRMKGSPAEGNLRAKTGTLNGVSSLSGYVHTADGEFLAFSVLMQKFPGSAQAYRQVQDRLGILLATMRRRVL